MSAHRTPLTTSDEPFDFGQQKEKNIDYEVVICDSQPRIAHLFHPRIQGKLVALCTKQVENGEGVKRYGPRSQPQINVLKAQGKHGAYELCKKCESARLRGDQLYCIVLETIGEKLEDYSQEFEYIHEANARTALASFRRGGIGKGKRIVACGLVVGYHLEDEKRGIVSA